MRIAFVGKGGSGKTTTAALFVNYLLEKNKTVLAIDSDINMHMGELLGFETAPAERMLSNPSAMTDIRTYLIGGNQRIGKISNFVKTSPPGKESNFVILSDDNHVVKNYSSKSGNLYFMTVGTYSEEGIGTSCYHGNLSILENILSHTVDGNGYVVADMVAGTDAFANTLHSQFDILVLVIEPTRKGIEVFKQYLSLAHSAGIADMLAVIGNKIKSSEDREFIKKNIPEEMLIGFLGDSDCLRKYEQTGGKLQIEQLEKENMELLDRLFEKVGSISPDNRKRLIRLYELHRKLMSKVRPELMDQIDESFDYDKILVKT